MNRGLSARSKAGCGSRGSKIRACQHKIWSTSRLCSGTMLILGIYHYQRPALRNFSSSTRLFADDTAVHRLIKSSQDQSHLQEDLQLLEEWENSWDMAFHPGKCTILPVISPKRIKENSDPKLPATQSKPCQCQLCQVPGCHDYSRPELGHPCTQHLQ